MKKKTLQFMALTGAFLVLSSCSETESAFVDETASTIETEIDSNADGTQMDLAKAEFTVTIENVSTPKPIFESGVFHTPVGKNEPAPLFPGDYYEFEINAGPVVLPNDGGTRLSFVTMFVQSNDLFFAPDEDGIALYDDSGMAIGCNGTPADVTDQIALWDAGTEVNEMTGGPNQKPQQDATVEDQGIDENGVVTKITNNYCSFGNILPENNQVIKVTIENVGSARFKVRIKNVSNGMTISTPALGADTRAAVPISPGVYAVHTMPAPFFEEGKAASGAGSVGSINGVEDIAEDGFLDALLIDTKEATGLIVPLSPGVWASHKSGIQPLFQNNSPDLGEGLDGIAEDGSPMKLAEILVTKEGVLNSSVFNTPTGAAEPGAIGPGGSYMFSFSAEEGESLSLATMFVQSNDWFYSFGGEGLTLFNNGVPVSGEVTEHVFLYDVGSEEDEFPGAGLHQVIRQSGIDSGPQDQNMNVRLVDEMSYPNIPTTSNVIKVTIGSVNK